MKIHGNIQGSFQAGAIKTRYLRFRESRIFGENTKVAEPKRAPDDHETTAVYP